MTGYIFDFQGKAFDPDGRLRGVVTPAQIAAHNATLAQAELERWNDKPEHFLVYVSGDAITTWSGVDLGRVTSARTGAWRYHNIGGHPCHPYRLTHIRVRGTNGAEYYGSYGSDNLQACRVRRVKGE